MHSIIKNLNLKIISLACLWIVGTIYLSFQYFRIADFPIGHDVIFHIHRSIAMQHNMNLSAILKDTIYPIPAVLFVWFYQLLNPMFGWDWPKVFLFTECLFLSLTALLSGVFAWAAFKKWPIVIITSFLVASSRWLGGSLYTGLMGEAFGWAAFMFSLIFLYQKKWLWFIPAFVLLAFSHPLPFGVMCIYLAVYLIFLAITQKKYSLLIYGFISLLALLTMGYYLLPEKRNLILSILQMEFPKEGEWRREYVIGSDYRRFNQYLLGVLGFLTLWLGKVKIVDKEQKNTLLLFALLSFLVTFKYLFGIHYLSFRFYTYFEIFNSLLAGFMVWHIADNLSKNRFNKATQLYKLLTFNFIFILLAFLAIWPNTHATKIFVKSQLIENTATTTPIPERSLIIESTHYIRSDLKIIGQKRWVWWYQPYANMLGIYEPNVYDEFNSIYFIEPNNLRQLIIKKNARYLYFSSVDKKYDFEEADFLKNVYNKHNIRIYELL